MKRIIIIILITLLPFSATGCWDMLELNEIGLVLLIGIDHDPKGDGFEVTVHVQAPGTGGAQEEGEGSSGASNIWITSSRGQTMMDAFRNLRGRAGFDLSFHHARLIIVGEDLARKGVKPVLDHMFRTREIRLNSLLLVCEGTAKDFMQLQSEFTKSSYEELEGILENEDDWSKSYTVELFRFVQNLFDPGNQPVASRLFTIKPEVSLTDPRDEEEEPIKEVMVAQGLAVFNDDQLVGWLTGTETIGYRYLKSIGGDIILVIPWRGAMVSIEATMISCLRTAYFTEGMPTMSIKLFITGVLVEFTGYANLTDADIMSELERLAGDQLATILRATDERAKELGVDFLDYGGILSRNHPKEWAHLNKNWRETFPTVDTVFDIRINLIHPGTILEPLPR